jgi:hypothetical protein
MNRSQTMRRAVRKNVGKTIAVMAATSVVALSWSQPAAAKDTGNTTWRRAEAPTVMEQVEPNTGRTLRGIGPAATTTTQWENRLEGVARRGEENPATPSAARCTNATQRIQKIITNYDSNYTRNGQAYDAMVKRLQTLITTLQAKNIDVSKIQTDLTTLQSKVTLFQTDKQAVLDQLKIAQSISCLDAPADFTAALQKGMSLVRTARATMLDIRSFYIGTLRTDIMAAVGESKGEKSE